MGMSALRRRETHSRYVGHGASKTKSRPEGSSRSMRSAVSTVNPPLASTIKNSPGCLSANEAAMRAASVEEKYHHLCRTHNLAETSGS